MVSHINGLILFYSRSNSTIVKPYGKFIHRPMSEVDEDAPKINYAMRKTKMAAWFVSHCNSKNNVRTIGN